MGAGATEPFLPFLGMFDQVFKHGQSNLTINICVASSFCNVLDGNSKMFLEA